MESTTPALENCKGIMFSSSLKESEESSMWEKKTLRYLNDKSNLSFIRTEIKKQSQGQLCEDAVDDVLNILIEALGKGADYDSSEYLSESNSLTLPQYVRKYAGFAVKRYFTAQSKEQKNFVAKTVKNDGSEDEMNPIDTVSDDKSARSFYEAELDLDTDLKQLRYKRYFFGVDIFNLLYVKVLSGFRDNEVTNSVISALGIGDIELKQAYNCAKNDPEFGEVLKDLAFSMGTSKDATGNILDMIGKYVYGRNRIDRALALAS